MKIQKLRAPLAALPLAVLAALPSHAQTDTYALLKETVVTATRVETRTDAVLSDVVVIEAVFNYPGMGKLMVDAVAYRDIPMVLACGASSCSTSCTSRRKAMAS